ncbi:MAG: YiiD C-terminal domain-containing protein [Arenicellales bacterium]|nr:YiiD C-terminal domain-containing protein [Arenicellales bacterium]
MIDLEQRCRKLEKLLHKEVPLSDSIGMVVHGYDGKRLELRADLKPNINIHGVAFGGSIYSMCALSGWGLLILRLQEHALDPRIMIAGGEIEYTQPVMQTIRASSYLPDQADFDRFVDRYTEKRRSSITVQVQVGLDDGAIAARFSGRYVAFAR